MLFCAEKLPEEHCNGHAYLQKINLDCKKHFETVVTPTVTQTPAESKDEGFYKDCVQRQEPRTQHIPQA